MTSQKNVPSKLIGDKSFEDIKHVSDENIEFWLARELMPLLEYVQWRNFENVIDKAKRACKNSGYNIDNHFADVSKKVELGSGANSKRSSGRINWK